MDMINSSIVTTALNAAALAGKISPVPMTKSHGEANLNELKTNAPTAPLQDEPSSPDDTASGVSENGDLNLGNKLNDQGPHLQPDQDTIKMFVGQVPRNMDENELRGMFEEFGPVYQINVLRDKITGQSKGCCFVTFYTRKAALEAQNALHNIKTLPGMHHPIQMKPADTENRNERKLFVGMVSKKYNESDVRVMFNSFGTIEECTVLRDTNGVSKGCAFVTFSTRQCAINAIKAMHHCQTMEGCSSPLVVKFADTQKEKEQKKVLQLQNNLWTLSTAPLAAAATTPTAAAATVANLITPQYLTALQLQALNGFPATTPATSLVNGNSVAVSVASGTGTTGTSTGQQQSQQPNPYQGSHLTAGATGAVTGSTTATQPAVNLLALQQLLASNGASQTAAAQLALANGQAVSSPVSNSLQQQPQLTNLYSLSNCNGTSTTSNTMATGTNELSSLSLAFPAAAAANFTTNPLNLTSLGSLATLTPAGLAYQSAAGLVNPSPIEDTNPLGSTSVATSAAGIPTMLAGTPVTTSMASSIQGLFNANAAAAAAAAAAAVAATTTPGLKQHEGPDGANLFIYHLPQEFTDSDLLQTFNPFGNVISAKVFIDKQTNLSKCFGFVSYDSPLSAQAAIQAMNGFQVGTKRLKVQLKRSKDASKPY